MGWSKGSSLMSDIISHIEQIESLTHEDKVEIFKGMIVEFEDRDCDNLMECEGESEAFDEAYFIIHPDHQEDLTEEEE